MKNKSNTFMMVGVTCLLLVIACIIFIFFDKFTIKNEIRLAETTECKVDNCSNCVKDNPNRCSLCKSGYHSSDGKCVQDVTSCPAGQGKNSFGGCSPCGAGYWSEEGSISCSNKCPEGYACNNGVKTKCSTYTPAGSSSCPQCNVNYCNACDKNDPNVCTKCWDGYTLTSIGKCYRRDSGNPPASSDACYKNSAINGYEYGKFDGVAGYTKVNSDQSKCNKITIKMVDGVGADLQGVAITFTPSSDPSKAATYTVGSKELELLDSGTYKIKETVVPNGYQIDATEIVITVGNDGVISVTGSVNVDLKNTNNSRNVSIIWKNNSQGGAAPVDPTDDTKEKCFIKHEGDGNNEYCFGTASQCANYSNTLDGRDSNSCKEDAACYKTENGKLLTGKYADRDGYEYYASACPKCYKNQKGDLVWGSFEGVDGYTLAPNIEEASCKATESESGSSNSKIIYIFLIILIVLVIIFVLSRKKPTNDNKKDKDSYEKEDYDYNYRI